MRTRITLAILSSVLTATVASPQVPAGGEFQVNTYVTNSQVAPSVAVDATGSFVVVWDSWWQDGMYDGVFAQRYDPSGVRRGSEFRVNVTTSGVEGEPSVAADAAGNFVVVWGGDDVYARRFEASGAPRAGEFLVNTFTTRMQRFPQVASDRSGNFVVAWTSDGQDGSWGGVFAQRYDAAGARRGSEFRVNTYTTGSQSVSSLSLDAAGNLLVAWHSWQFSGSHGAFGQRFDSSGEPLGIEFTVKPLMPRLHGFPSAACAPAGDFIFALGTDGEDGDGRGISAKLYDATGTLRGVEFRVNTYTTGYQSAPSLAVDAGGNFVIVWRDWAGQDGSGDGVFGQRYDSAGLRRGTEFQVNTFTTGAQFGPRVASDAVGNFVVVWMSNGQDGSEAGIFAQRFGGIHTAALEIDSTPAGSDGNRVLEPGESVDVKPSWRNVNGATQSFDGGALGFTGPAAAGLTYQLLDGSGLYGSVANGAIRQCSDCYRVGVMWSGTRPAVHWDATFTERLTPDVLGQTKPWSLHVGQSFPDVPKTSLFYRDVETLLHKGITGGCTATQFCPGNPVTREQLAVFTLEGREGAGYRPPPCGTTPMFADVPSSSFFCGWIEELARRGVVGGCGGGNYCPAASVTREQMPVFVLRLLDPTLDPPACTTPLFADVPASNPFCRWIEELARRGVVAGCGGGNYCPAAPVTRDQMAAFLVGTYALTLYGP